MSPSAAACSSPTTPTAPETSRPRRATPLASGAPTGGCVRPQPEVAVYTAPGVSPGTHDHDGPGHGRDRGLVEPGTRRAWIDALLRMAAASLLDSSWTIEHPTDWPQAEQHALRSRVGEVSVSFAPQAGMAAGLRICAGGACVDGSVDGLLKDRAYIESLLLAASGAHGSKDPADRSPR